MSVTPSGCPGPLALSLQLRVRADGFSSSGHVGLPASSICWCPALRKIGRNQAFPPPPKDKKAPGKLSWMLCFFQSWRAKNDPCVGHSSSALGCCFETEKGL